MTATAARDTTLCPCGSGLPIDDDDCCIVCWFERLPEVVRDVRQSLWTQRYIARHARPEATDEAAG